MGQPESAEFPKPEKRFPVFQFELFFWTQPGLLSGTTRGITC
jgi:hypothetical protein